MQRSLLRLSLAIFLGLPLAAPAQPEVRIERRGEAFAVHMETPIAADAAVAWQVLTDYDHLADFVPDMRASRVVSAPGEPLRIEQQGGAGFLFFKFTVDVELAIDEVPPLRLGFRAIRGNMRRMQGEWRIDRADGGILLVYDAELQPTFWVPPLIGPAVMRRDVANQIAGVVREIERRQGGTPTQLKIEK
jgi:hypothetical protein